MLLLSGLVVVLVLNGYNWWKINSATESIIDISNILFFLATSVLLLVVVFLVKFDRSTRVNPATDTSSPVSADELSQTSDKQQTLSQILDAHAVLTSLMEKPHSKEPYVVLLKKLELLTGAVSSAIYVADDIVSELFLLASTEAPEMSWPASTQYNDLSVTSPELKLITDYVSNKYKLVDIHLHRGLENRAELILEFPVEVNVSRQIHDHLEVHSAVLSEILYIAKTAQINLRNVQYEERAAIARELHDSIAQSLSYMKIQTSRLQDLLSDTELPSSDDVMMIDSVILDLRTTMNVAYRHVRELISTFRIAMGGRNFSQALEDAINEFSNRSIINIDVDNRLPENALTVSEEIQLLHIIREGLSNVVRHSHATAAQVSVHYSKDAEVKVTLEDNGVGLPETFDRERHYGIIIMQERVLALEGSIHFDTPDDRGTRILITFTSTGNHAEELNLNDT